MSFYGTWKFRLLNLLSAFEEFSCLKQNIQTTLLFHLVVNVFQLLLLKEQKCFYLYCRQCKLYIHILYAQTRQVPKAFHHIGAAIRQNVILRRPFKPYRKLQTHSRVRQLINPLT